MKKITDLLFKRGKVGSMLEATQAASNISTCGVHDENVYPNVRGLEFCRSCESGMCYICANEHADDFHTIDWGFDIFNKMESPRNDLND